MAVSLCLAVELVVIVVNLDFVAKGFLKTAARRKKVRWGWSLDFKKETVFKQPYKMATNIQYF